MSVRVRVKSGVSFSFWRISLLKNWYFNRFFNHNNSMAICCYLLLTHILSLTRFYFCIKINKARTDATCMHVTARGEVNLLCYNIIIELHKIRLYFLLFYFHQTEIYSTRERAYVEWNVLLLTIITIAGNCWMYGKYSTIKNVHVRPMSFNKYPVFSAQ